MLRSRDQRHIPLADRPGGPSRLTVVEQNDEGMTSTALVIPAGRVDPGTNAVNCTIAILAIEHDRRASSAGILFECKARDERERKRTLVRDRTNEFRNVAIGRETKLEADCLRLYGQVIKRIWWMPRR